MVLGGILALVAKADQQLVALILLRTKMVIMEALDQVAAAVAAVQEVHLVAIGKDLVAVAA